MKKHQSNQSWIQAHLKDPFVIKANKEGYRARAIYKLQEIQDKYKFISSNSIVIDLGAAPGSWSQYLVKIVSNNGKIFALDRLDLDKIPKVHIIKGDFTSEETLAELVRIVGAKSSIDCVLSDMAPNTSGISQVDQLRSVALVEQVVDFAKIMLKENGTLFAKVFQGSGLDSVVCELKKQFTNVSLKKPKASRAHSNEIYILARGYKHNNYLLHSGELDAIFNNNDMI